jgi:hypothetical protein
MSRQDLDRLLATLGPVPPPTARRARARWYADLCDAMIHTLMADPAAEDRLLHAIFEGDRRSA